MRSILIGTACLLLFTHGTALPVHSQDTKTTIKKAKAFCNDGINLAEKSINLSVKGLITAGLSQGSAAALENVSALQIITMHMNCNLFVGDKLTAQQFLDKQTQIFQFGVDMESLRALAEIIQAGKQASPGSSLNANASNTNKQPASSSSTTDKGGASPSTGTTDKKPTDAGSTSPQESKNTGKSGTTTGTSSVEPTIRSIAADLGITLKNNIGVSQSGHSDLIQSGVDRLIAVYSPAPMSQ